MAEPQAGEDGCVHLVLDDYVIALPWQPEALQGNSNSSSSDISCSNSLGL